MRIRSSFALMATTVMLVAACGGASTTPAPTAAAPTPPPATAVAPTAVPATPTAATPTTVPATPTAAPQSVAPPSSSTAPTGSSTGGNWKIGVVTDVGTVNDKNFNQYSYEGAVAGATAIGAAAPQYAVPTSSTDYAPDIQNFVSQGFNLIVTVGFNLNTDTLKSAKANPKVWFIGVDQSACITATGDPDTAATPTCAGDASKLLPNFVGLQYQEDQAGYLAGIVAGSISANKNVAAIGGINLVPAVVRYIQGYPLGAMSVDPSMKVDIGYVTTSDFTKAFGDPTAGKDFADQFIQSKHPDVVFQVAGNTGNGILQSACAAGIYGIGVDVDEWGSLKAATDPTYQCIVTSAEKHLSSSVAATIQAIAAGTTPAVDASGALHFNATNDGIGVSQEQDGKNLITPAIQTLLDTALAGMKSGSLTTCPTTCGQP